MTVETEFRRGEEVCVPLRHRSVTVQLVLTDLQTPGGDAASEQLETQHLVSRSGEMFIGDFYQIRLGDSAVLTTGGIGFLKTVS